MPYSFPNTADTIEIGTGLTLGTTFTYYARFSLHTTTGVRVIAQAHDFTHEYFQLLVSGPDLLAYTYTTNDVLAQWTHGWTVDTVHTVVVTWDGTALKLYADTDATPKVTNNTLPGTAYQNSAIDLALGNGIAHTNPLNGTLYDVGYWNGVVLTGAQAAALGSHDASGITLPQDYWPLDTDALALYGTRDGTVTGADLAAGDGLNLYAPPAQATYFVKTGGSDSANGRSDGAAWATVAKVNATTLNPGDTVQFNGGDTWSEEIAPTISGGGAAATPVVFTTYGTGKATFTPPAGSMGFTADNLQGLTIENLIFQSSDNLATQTIGTYGIQIRNSGTTQLGGIHILNCEAYDFSYAGIMVWGNNIAQTNGYGWNDVQVTGCETAGNQAQGIAVVNVMADTVGFNMSNCYIADCISHDNPGTSSASPIPDCQGNGILGFGWTGGTIERCTVYDNCTAASGVGGGGGGAWFRACSGSILQWCEAYGQGGATVDGGGIGIDIGVINCILQYNYTHDNRQSIQSYSSGSGNVIRYNVSENDARGNSESDYAAINIGASSSVDIYGNTVVNTRNAGDPVAVRVSGGGSARLFNNILITVGSGGRVLLVTGAGTVVANGNAYWQISDTTTFRATWGASTYTSLADFRTASSQETGTGFNIDPALVDPGTAGTIGAPTSANALRGGLGMYRPQTGSWVAEAGLDLDAYSITSPGTQDFFGLTLPTSGPTTLGVALSAATGSADELLLLFAGHAEARV